MSGSSSAPSRLYCPVTRAAMPSSVVAPGDHREEDRGRDVAAVAGAEGHNEEHRQERDAHEADRVRDRPRVAAAGRAASRAAGRPSGRGRAGASWSGKLAPQLAAASAAAPSSGTLRFSWPRLHLHLELARLEARACPTVSAQRAAEQLGVGELLAGARRRGRRRARRARPRAAPRRGARPRSRASSPSLPSVTSSTSKGASARGQEMPCSSAHCSTAAATMRAGPMP